MKLSIVIPTLDGTLPGGLPCSGGEVELVVVRGTSPVSVARNVGLERATGEWIAWADADDSLSGGWLDAVLGAIDEAAARGDDVISFGASVARSNGRSLDVRYRAEKCRVPARRYLLDVLRDIGGSTWLWNKVFRKKLFEGVTFAGETQEDMRILPRVLSRARSVLVMPDILYVYTRPEKSLTHDGGGDTNAEGLISAIGDNLPDVQDAAAIMPAWKEGCALRAADWLLHASRHSRRTGSAKDLAKFLRANFWRILLDPAQGTRTKLKAFYAALLH